MLQVSLKKNFGLLNGYEEFMKKFGLHISMAVPNPLSFLPLSTIRPTIALESF